ncbi:hypothetical protein BaRGS_00010457 [Batillaria attramentaria]|uniref:Uncharacterized protein n=1 Tax=Batillaria attramentaria TaxID=370345 RepID=A0ABD0LFE8_9CAEN
MRQTLPRQRHSPDLGSAHRLFSNSGTKRQKTNPSGSKGGGGATIHNHTTTPSSFFISNRPSTFEPPSLPFSSSATTHPPSYLHAFQFLHQQPTMHLSTSPLPVSSSVAKHPSSYLHPFQFLHQQPPIHLCNSTPSGFFISGQPSTFVLPPLKVSSSAANHSPSHSSFISTSTFSSPTTRHPPTLIPPPSSVLHQHLPHPPFPPPLPPALPTSFLSLPEK